MMECQYDSAKRNSYSLRVWRTDAPQQSLHLHKSISLLFPSNNNYSLPPSAYHRYSVRLPDREFAPYTFIIYIGPFIGTANYNCLIHAVPLITGSKCIDQFLPGTTLYRQSGINLEENNIHLPQSIHEDGSHSIKYRNPVLSHYSCQIDLPHFQTVSFQSVRKAPDSTSSPTGGSWAVSPINNKRHPVPE